VTHDEPRTAQPPAEFDSYELVILRRPADPPVFDDETRELLHAQHLGHFATMKDAGYLKVSGPLADQADESMRGICIYQVGSLAEARRLAELDPAIRAGIFEIEVLTWLTAKGALSFP
jgi:uncharacterized protein